MRHRVKYEVHLTPAQERALWEQAEQVGLCEKVPRYRWEQRALVARMFEEYGKNTCLDWIQEKLSNESAQL
jgi:hypothetical protein